MAKYILKLFFLLQLVVIFCWYLGSFLLPNMRETFCGEDLKDFETQPLIWSRANFDGAHYVSIARSGYGYLQQAFFPFYPNLIRFFQPLMKSFVFSGIFISSAFFLAMLFLLVKIFKNSGEGEADIKKTLLLMVIFPTSFYFVSVYTESLFLFLILLSFYLAEKRRWLPAALVAGLAANTRLVGIFLLPALLYEYYEHESKRGMKARITAAGKVLAHRLKFGYFVYLFKSRWRHIKNVFLILFSSWGLLTYMFYLKENFGDYFYFIKVQPDFGAQRSVSKIILLYQVFWRYLKMIFTVDVGNIIYFNIWLEVLMTLFFLVLLILGWIKFKIRRSWLIFSTLAFLLPSLTGTFSSMPRYVLIFFPCFLILAKLKPTKVFYFLSFILLLICASMFLRGYWLA